MSDPILADQVRAFAFREFLGPASAGSIVTIRSGDVHKGLAFADRIPLVTAALRARKFRAQYNLVLLEETGPKSGPNTSFTFKRHQPPPPLKPLRWVEVTSLEDGHGGLGWELGYWLWSPARSTDGADRYAIVREVAPADRVLHYVSGVIPGRPNERVLYGVSEVAEEAEETTTKPPSPGAWADAASYLRVRLTNFIEFPFKIGASQIEADLRDFILAELADRPKHYPYATYGDGFRVTQGAYLAALSPALADALGELTGTLSGQGDRNETEEEVRKAARSFAEGERGRREQSFFKRNPALREEAIAVHGLNCGGCGENFGAKYGPLGEGYIEIHHLNPLAERGDASVPTTVDDVLPLCANCHRVVHRKRPAVGIDELKRVIAEARGKSI